MTKQWVDFIKLHLQQPHKYGIALLKGEHAFVMEIEDGEWVINKIEKGCELVSKATTSNSILKVIHHATPLHIASPRS